MSSMGKQGSAYSQEGSGEAVRGAGFADSHQ